jgi:O-antigen/teichoic acid export membrane protein
VSVGINSDIIASSGKFRFDTLFNIILLFVSIIANFIFIPIFGGIGAGIAAVVSFFTFNFLKWMFLLIKYKMQPLNHKQLIVLIIAAVSFLAGFYFPVISNVYLDLFVRSTLTLLIYGSAILIFKVSDDINQRFIVYKNFLLKKLSFY